MCPLYFTPKYLIEAFIGIQVSADSVRGLGEFSREAEHSLIDGKRSQRV